MLEHGAYYISHLTSKGLSRDSVLQQENVLTQFYIYLQEKNILDHKKFQIEYIKKTRYKSYAKSLFRNSSISIQIPPLNNRKKYQNKLKDFGTDRYDLIRLFLNSAQETAPEIAFGIALQFFGGLRRGEIVNLTVPDLEVKLHESMLVRIRDNRDVLFNHLADTRAEYPKRVNYLPRHLSQQIVLVNPTVWGLYLNHIELIQRRKTTNNGYLALFTDKIGNPISGRNYDRKFKLIKENFLSTLYNLERYEDYIRMTNGSWSTHIGRGCFTNILFNMGLSPTQIAIARGDRNINSAMDYVDNINAYNALTKTVNQISKITTVFE